VDYIEKYSIHPIPLYNRFNYISLIYLTFTGQLDDYFKSAKQSCVFVSHKTLTLGDVMRYIIKPTVFTALIVVALTAGLWAGASCEKSSQEGKTKKTTNSEQAPANPYLTVLRRDQRASHKPNDGNHPGGQVGHSRSCPY
jgi:hypothetical protein